MCSYSTHSFCGFVRVTTVTIVISSLLLLWSIVVLIASIVMTLQERETFSDLLIIGVVLDILASVLAIVGTLKKIPLCMVPVMANQVLSIVGAVEKIVFICLAVGTTPGDHVYVVVGSALGVQLINLAFASWFLHIIINCYTFLKTEISGNICV